MWSVQFELCKELLKHGAKLSCALGGREEVFVRRLQDSSSCRYLWHGTWAAVKTPLEQLSHWLWATDVPNKLLRGSFEIILSKCEIKRKTILKCWKPSIWSFALLGIATLSE